MWNKVSTVKLIKTIEKYPILWDRGNEKYKDKLEKSAILDHIAQLFGTAPEEINRKMHNLRSQFNGEVKRHSNTNGKISSWLYYQDMLFISQCSTYIPPRLRKSDVKTEEELPKRVFRKRKAPVVEQDVKDIKPSVNIGVTLRSGPSTSGNQKEAKVRKIKPKIEKKELDNNCNLLAVKSEPRRASLRRNKAIVTSSNMNIDNNNIASDNVTLDDAPLPNLAIEDQNEAFGNYIANELRLLATEERKSLMMDMIRHVVIRVKGMEDIELYHRIFAMRLHNSGDVCEASWVSQSNSVGLLVGPDGTVIKQEYC